MKLSASAFAAEVAELRNSDPDMSAMRAFITVANNAQARQMDIDTDVPLWPVRMLEPPMKGSPARTVSAVFKTDSDDATFTGEAGSQTHVRAGHSEKYTLLLMTPNKAAASKKNVINADLQAHDRNQLSWQVGPYHGTINMAEIDSMLVSLSGHVDVTVVRVELLSHTQRVAALAHNFPVVHLVFQVRMDKLGGLSVSNVHLELSPRANAVLRNDVRPLSIDSSLRYVLRRAVVDTVAIAAHTEATVSHIVRDLGLSALGVFCMHAGHNLMLGAFAKLGHVLTNELAHAALVPLGTLSQTIVAAAVLYHASASGLNPMSTTLLDELLSARGGGSAGIRAALSSLYGTRMPSLLDLLTHTSGLPTAVQMRPEDLDAAVSPVPTLLTNTNQDEVFAELLRDRTTLLFDKPGKARIESPLNYALLAYAFDLRALLASFMAALGIAEHAYALGTSDEHGVYAAYSGVSMSPAAMIKFVSNSNLIPSDWMADDDERKRQRRNGHLQSAFAMLQQPASGSSGAKYYGAGNLIVMSHGSSGRPVLVLAADVGCSHSLVLSVTPSLHSATVSYATHSKGHTLLALVPRLIADIVLRAEEVGAAWTADMRAHMSHAMHRLQRRASLLNRQQRMVESAVDASVVPYINAKLHSAFEDPASHNSTHLELLIVDGKLLARLSACGSKQDFVVVSDDGQLRAIDPITGVLGDYVELAVLESAKYMSVRKQCIMFRGHLFVPRDVGEALLGMMNKDCRYHHNLRDGHREYAAFMAPKPAAAPKPSASAPALPAKSAKADSNPFNSDTDDSDGDEADTDDEAGSLSAMPPVPPPRSPLADLEPIEGKFNDLIHMMLSKFERMPCGHISKRVGRFAWIYATARAFINVVAFPVNTMYAGQAFECVQKK